MEGRAIFVLVIVMVVSGFCACEAEAGVGVTVAGDLEVLPLDDFEPLGESGGPFTPSSKDYQLTNVGPNSIYWGIAKTADWLDFDSVVESLQSTPGDFELDLVGVYSTWGLLEPNESITVRAGLNATAETLGVGVYTDTLTFTDITHEAEETRDVTLTVALGVDIWVEPNSFDVNIPEGTSLTETLTIGNDGMIEDLNFTIQTRAVGGSGGAVEGIGGVSTIGVKGIFSTPKSHDFAVLGNRPYRQGELIVRFAGKANGALRSKRERNQILSSLGGGTIKRDFRIVPGLSAIKLPPGMTVEKAVKNFNKAKGILYAEPNYEVRALSRFPDDPRFNDLWGMHNTGQTGGTVDADIDAPEAWDIATGTGEIIVAVIDTGVDYTHPDLVANIWVNEGEIPGNGIDDDDNGYVDDVYGYDFCNNDGDPMDDHYHGTHCAGTIGAVGDNGEGVAGVCWNVRIMALKFLNSGGSGSTSDAIDCVEYSTLMGANLSSNSWGGGGYSQGLKDAIEAAAAAGMLFVAAAGNDNEDTDVYPHYPSSYDCESLISVMATDKDDNKSSFSNYGPTSVDLGAPGSDILSCKLGGGYKYASGTSMATPHVAGACAFLWSMNPALSNSEVKGILLQTVDEIPALSGKCVSDGRLNLYNAILETGTPWLEIEPGEGTVGPGDWNEVDVTFNAMEIEPGTYEAEILVLSDDPCNPTVVVPVTMTVSPDDLVVTPTAGFEPNGTRGGPFEPECATYTLTNNGTSAVSWAAYLTEDWVAADPCEGVLEPNESVDVNVCVTPAADLLDPNVYIETLIFENINSGSIKQRLVTLTVEPPDCFTESFDASTDLEGLMLTFIPDGSTAYYEACREEVNEFPTDPNGGTYVPLGDDDFAEVTLSDGAEVLFYGTSYDRFYIGSNGYITFGDGDTEYSTSLENHFNMPRISGLFTDLTPADNQSISYKQLDDRVVVTFKDVPLYGDKQAKNSFQVEIFFVDGSICVSWLDIAATASVAGLSEGYGLPPAFFTESDLSGYPPCWPFCDFDRDYLVGWLDLGMFVSHWLEADCNIPYWCGRADLDFSSAVDMLDWSIFAENWLTEIEKWWLLPISHWKFDEGEGSIAYDSVGNNHGTLNGDPNWVAGKIGSFALDFDGDGDYIEIPDDDSLTPSNKITIALWMYNRGGQNAGIYKWAACPGNSGSPGSSRAYYMEVLDSTSKLKFRIYSSVDNSDVIESSSTVSLNQWHHIAGTFDQSEAAIYIDGQLDNSMTMLVSSIMNDAQPLTVAGCWSYCDGVNLSSRLNGLADDVRIYDRALTAEEVWELYREGMGYKAFDPEPADGAVEVDPDVILSWSPGKDALSHNVYFGTDYNDVNEADISDPNVYMGNQEPNSWDPNNYDANGLEYLTTYYWRIDEVDDSNDRCKGDIWNFTTWAEFDPNLGLVGWWEFEEGGGTDANDSSGNGNHGTLNGDPNWVTGRIGSYALEFDGDGDYVGVAPDSSLNVQHVTMCAWAKVYDATPSHNIFILNREMTEPGTYTLYLKDSTHKWQAQVRLDGSEGTDRIAASNETAITEWTHICGTYDGDKLKLYVNAVLQVDVDDTNGALDPDNPDILTIAAHPQPTQYFDGIIDDVRIYDRALTAGEIWELYQSGLGY